jgi:ubiquinone/menaquinone biosynthesis C-methylase UbiE
MFSREKLRKKEYFHRLFSERASIDYWETVYDRRDSLGVTLRRRMRTALSWLDGSNLPKNSKILDVGCGAGKLSKEIVDRGYEVLAMDFSYNMIRKADAICNVNDKSHIKFLQGDIESLPFKDSVFDVVLCLGVVTYLRSEKKALHEMSRVLKPGGTLILSILNKFSLAKCLDISAFVTRRLQQIMGYGIGTFEKRGEIRKNCAGLRSYFIPGLRNSLRIAGFTELDCTAIRYGPLTFLGQKIFPEGININITTFLEKFSNLPLIMTFGDMCLFKVKKVR